MLLLRAEALGMCFGVRDALAALDALPRPRSVTIHGELVHNPEVARRLAARGFRQSPEQARAVPDTPTVLVTAHGISARERHRLDRAGKQLVDTTCPLVRRAHQAAHDLARQGRRIVVLGKRGHVEVRGLVEDHAGAVVVESEADATWFGPGRLGVLCQTTLPEDSARRLLAAVRRANPGLDLRFVDTICQPTKARQQALRNLLDRVAALVVVGGPNSNNTAALVALAEQSGVPAFRVAAADELDLAALSRFPVVGLTAGTSALAETVDAVEMALRAHAAGALRPAGARQPPPDSPGTDVLRVATRP